MVPFYGVILFRFKIKLLSVVVSLTKGDIYMWKYHIYYKILDWCRTIFSFPQAMWMHWMFSSILRLNWNINPSGAEMEYSGQARSMPWQLMPWLLMSPGRQQPWYWLCRINRFLSSMVSITCTPAIVLRTDKEFQYYFSLNQFSTSRVNHKFAWVSDLVT